MATFRCIVCGNQVHEAFRSKTKWFTDAMIGKAGDNPKDICMRCKAPPPNDGGSPNTPALPKAA